MPAYVLDLHLPGHVPGVQNPSLRVRYVGPNGAMTDEYVEVPDLMGLPLDLRTAKAFCNPAIQARQGVLYGPGS